MTLSAQYCVRIAASTAPGPQSRVRKQFNTLVKKLEAERVKLALWRAQLPQIHALADSEYLPLAQTFDAHRKALLLALDRAYYDKAMGKKDKKKLVELICSMALALMSGDQDDEVVKALYNKHSGRDFNLDLEQEQAVMCKMVAAMTGVELDDDTDFSSPDAFFKTMQEKMAERARAEEPAGPAHPAKPAKLSAREAREARHQAEEVKLKQSVRDIFRKLASALHPDRETDPAQHARKTALMQRANVAYAANDLLALLELQLEVDQIDQAGLDNLGDDRIKQYNRILDGQVNQIKSEIHALESAFALDMGWEFGLRRTPQAMLRGLRADIKEMRANVKHIEADLEGFADIKKIKQWMKGFHIAEDESMYGEPWF
ncbi:hypothetical protein AAKU55_005242 [Oxalobacteraceae bacterium GrIS 1.11]